MTYKVLADFTLLIHLLWILFLFFGAYVGAKYRVARILHLSGLAFALITEIFGWYCPLTYLEVWLRSKHDPRWVYAGSFIVHYVEKIVYLELSRTLIVIGTVMLVGFNLWFYWGRNRGKRLWGPLNNSNFGLRQESTPIPSYLHRKVRWNSKRLSSFRAWS